MSNVDALRSWSERTGTSARTIQRANEEWANALSHGLGLGLSILASGLLLRRVLQGGSPANTIACLVYVSSLIALYAASTFSHWVREPESKSRWEAWDQGLIYLLIAGNFTPLAVSCFQGWWHLTTVAIWTLALTGFVSKVAFRHRVDGISLVLYLGLGWMTALGIPPMLASAPLAACGLALGGGVAYTVGSAFLMNDHRAPYLHVGWHVSVIVGSFFHYLAVWLCISMST